MNSIYEAPQTDDGWIKDISLIAPGKLVITAEFLLPPRFQERIRNHNEYVRFVARSRIARLGINVSPSAPIDFRGTIATLRATVEALVKGYAIGEHLEKMFLLGLRIGRLVYCDPARRLAVEQARRALLNREFQLTAQFPSEAGGLITILPHRCIYDLQQPLTLQDLIAIVARYNGNTMINRVQLRRDVEHIIIEPGEAVITSCTAFLHKHFVVLDSRPETNGYHFESTVLDPVTTRGSRVYLEFYNRTQHKIVDPSVAIEIYSADEVPIEQRRWCGAPPRHERSAAGENDQNRDYSELVRLYALSEQKSSPGSYLHRPVTIITNIKKALSTNLPQAVWVNPEAPKSAVAAAAARYLESGTSRSDYYDIAILRQIARRAGATVLLRYFPNVIEHIQLCRAASEGRIKRIVFREASFEHGPFLSAHDHSRLADYEALGVEVLWCNDIFKEVALHIYRGRGPRGFFVPLPNVSDFATRLVIAVYGSTLALSEKQYAPFKQLLEKLSAFFAGQVALLTGGGPGAMQQAADIGKSLGLAVGCNFLEIVDQQLKGSKDFYQTFQQTARHFRQRWFDISSFQLFCIGGLGTMEEIGLTLTDMKLSVTDRGPLVFFGRSREDLYWSHLREQLNVIVEEKRGPAWLSTHVLMTDDPDEVISFYERVLELGLQESPNNIQ